MRPWGYSTFTYDAAGRQIRITNPLGFLATTVYNAAGQAVVQVDPLLNRTTQVHDLGGGKGDKSK